MCLGSRVREADGLWSCEGEVVLILMNGSMPSVVRYRAEIPLGLLVTPLGGLGVKTAFATDMEVAVDNGAFAGFDAARFRRLLARVPDPGRCLWVAAPDVVGDARATLALYDEWEPEIRSGGFRVALVAQDGLTSAMMAGYWTRCDAFFVGGTDAFKLPPGVPPAVALIREAQDRGKWVHFGRVNGVGRVNYCERLGVDSVDGSGFVRTSRDKFPRLARYFARRDRMELFG